MKFYVIGIDDNKEQYFTEKINEVISTHHIFSGGARHHEIVKDLLPEDYRWIEIKVPLDEVFVLYKEYDEVVVFASGDPLFFGFANTIQRKMPKAELIVYPYFNSLQLLAHRLVLPYQDMHIVSLTGRPWHKFDEALILGYNMIGVLTDNKLHIPSLIAQRMLDYGYDNYTMSVGELLGNNEEEKVSTLKLADVVNREFAFPNNIILCKTYSRKRPFGIPESEFNLLNGRAKMITKMPIRLLSLSMLDLREKHTLWDIGFCTGSVSIEAKLQFPHLNIIAFEIREEGKELIEINSRKIGTPGIDFHIGDFTTADISSYPQPDAIFIGGHGGKMKEIIKKVEDILLPNGIIVFNSVSDESFELFHSSIEKSCMTLNEITSIKINDHNTIKIMKAIK
ncbi:precorrin-6y C5,15-methyltransferase (decarboxylating) subunit CbiE [Dysgonomonas sp. Marseille-P4361]|uniref:precorrin-6y C5,15-methyltransferase (decarboxylating) subunit CbiE n=1 Tax=Dysgonomonas sp. Marseille-P4361 TaxID=2161820 RepID=UPI000D55C67F|nr:precorrin-6y C5,15-methyltransferase (decarboxylating) subunit CbiE [Dysgonomonas sp. Marseille-P4361]